MQADVAAELDDDAEIRFADERSEALLEDADDEPVRDDGVLMAIGRGRAGRATRYEVEVEVYRSEDDSSKRRAHRRHALVAVDGDVGVGRPARS